MATISTADRFLGSLLGAYIGHSYRGNSQLAVPNLADSQLYQPQNPKTPKPQNPKTPKPHFNEFMIIKPDLLLFERFLYEYLCA